jgi:hypothetical protein
VNVSARSLRRAVIRAARTALGYAAYPGAVIGAGRRRADFDAVECYVMFLGYPRSGHTLPGAMLNAHPHAVIAHELDALQYVGIGFNRRQLFSVICDRDQWFCRRNCEWTGYSYAVPNQWQGRYDALRVIGDKKGAASARRLSEDPALLDKLRRAVRVPLRLIHVTRNPFDNIATMAARQSRPIEDATATYFRLCEAVEQTIARCDRTEIIHLRHEDLVAAPAERLRMLCEFVGLEPSRAYLDDCASIVFPSPVRTRAGARYSDQARARIQDRLNGFSFLRGYTFDS